MQFFQKFLNFFRFILNLFLFKNISKIRFLLRADVAINAASKMTCHHVARCICAMWLTRVHV